MRNIPGIENNPAAIVQQGKLGFVSSLLHSVRGNLERVFHMEDTPVKGVSKKGVNIEFSEGERVIFHAETKIENGIAWLLSKEGMEKEGKLILDLVHPKYLSPTGKNDLRGFHKSSPYTLYRGSFQGKGGYYFTQQTGTIVNIFRRIGEPPIYSGRPSVESYQVEKKQVH